ncbi:MAG TPA: hypothetical protein VEI83_13995 [Acidimicrobiales bacterium]|nr:hypothetical protein [Acidimicrobiales bacterium]
MSADIAYADPAERHRWTPEQRSLTVKIAGAFVIGLITVGVIGPIVLTVIIGLAQGYSR